VEASHHQHRGREKANGAHDVMIHAFRSYYATYQRLPNAKVILYSNAGHDFLFQHAGIVGTAS
jgi:hypothetical protein